MNQPQLKCCIDQVLPKELGIPAAVAAIKENPLNRVAPSDVVETITPAGEELFVLTAQKWQNGKNLRVHFMDGDPIVQSKVEYWAKQWSTFANITFEFGASQEEAEIRISFEQAGSWSYIGTDALVVPKDQPTMNYGWLTPGTEDNEYSRVVLHEFGHALGCPHEHSHPTNDIHWNKPVVYDYYKKTAGWTEAMADNNLFQKYSKDITQFSEFDPHSIMLYAIPAEHTTDGFSVGWNRELSQTDIDFISRVYPKS